MFRCVSIIHNYIGNTVIKGLHHVRSICPLDLTQRTTVTINGKKSISFYHNRHHTRSIIIMISVTVEWFYSKESNKSVHISKDVIIKESRYLSGILTHEKDLSTLSVFLNYPKEFEEYVLPVFIDNTLEWKDAITNWYIMDQESYGNALCRLLHIAEFLVIDELIFIVQHQISASLFPNITKCEEFNEMCISKNQMRHFLVYYSENKGIFKLGLLLDWLKDSSAESVREAKLWSEKTLGNSWVNIFTCDKLLLKEWTSFVNTHENVLDPFFTIREVKHIFGSCRFRYEGKELILQNYFN